MKMAITVCAAILAGLLAPAPGWSAPSEGVTLCTWGGTPDAATGTVSFKPGLTNTPSTTAGKVVAIGWMECSDGFNGKVTFDGEVPAGSTCLVQWFDGKVKGLPGVDRLSGPGFAGLVQEFLYDKEGNVVGSDQPQVYSGIGQGGSEVSDCNTPEGFTDAIFSSTVEIWG